MTEFVERGEVVYTYLEVTLVPFGQFPIHRRIQCEEGIGFTEEWIEDTIEGCLKALDKDYPTDAYATVRVSPNQIRFEYIGTKGVVN